MACCKVVFGDDCSSTHTSQRKEYTVRRISSDICCVDSGPRRVCRKESRGLMGGTSEYNCESRCCSVFRTP